MSTFALKRGAKGPRLTGVLTKGDGTPQDLSGASLKLYLKHRRSGAMTVNGAGATIDSAVDGAWGFDWPDTSAYPLGIHFVEVEVLGLSPTPVRFPSTGYKYVNVERQLSA